MFRSTFLTMTIGIITGTLGVMVDGIVIGRFLGPDAIAAYGVVIPLIPILIMIGGIMVSGAQQLCGRYMSRGDTDGAAGVFSLSVTLGVLISVLYMIVILLFSSGLVRFLGAANEAAHLYQDGRAYLIGISFSFVFTVMNMVLQPYLQLEGDRKKVIFSVLLTLSVNTAGDLFVALVWKKGLFGIAMATVISGMAGLLVLMSHFAGDTIFKFRLSNIRWKETKNLLIRGAPMAVNRISYSVKVIALNRIVIAIAGTTALTAISVQNNLYSFFSSLGTGVGLSMLMVTGILEGERSRGVLRTLLQIGVKRGMIINAAAGALLFLLSEPLAGVYIRGNDAAVRYAAVCMRFFAASLVFFAVSHAYYNFLQGTGRLRLTVLYVVLEVFLLPFACAWLLGRIFGVMGVWAAFLVSEMLMMPVYYIAASVKNRHMPKNTDDFMMLRAGYDIPEEMHREWMMEKMEEVTAAAEEAYAFLARNNMDNRKCMFTSLCIEEMAKNIIEHGVPGKGRLTVYVRVVLTEEGLVLRIRDNGKYFNPKEWIRCNLSEDKTKNIGIRMVCGIAKDFRYVNTMGMNNLIVSF